jgi:ATP/maltotriose-dependent transcriptional regulator MalT
MTDEDWATLEPNERAFAVQWLGLDEAERDAFCRQLLAAIEVLQRFRIFEDGEASPST